MTVRDERAAAIRRHYRRLCDSLTEGMAGLLDDLDAIDRRAMAEPRAPTDAEITEWIRVHEREFEAMVRKWNRINGGSGVKAVFGDAPESVPPLTSMPAVEQAAPAKTATRRRRTT